MSFCALCLSLSLSLYPLDSSIRDVGASGSSPMTTISMPSSKSIDDLPSSMPNLEEDLRDFGPDDNDSLDRDPAASGCGCGSVMERAGAGRLVDDRLNRLPDLIRSAKSPRILAADDDDDRDLLVAGRVSVVVEAFSEGLRRSDPSVLFRPVPPPPPPEVAKDWR